LLAGSGWNWACWQDQVGTVLASRIR